MYRFVARWSNYKDGGTFLSGCFDTKAECIEACKDFAGCLWEQGFRLREMSIFSWLDGADPGMPRFNWEITTAGGMETRRYTGTTYGSIGDAKDAVEAYLRNNSLGDVISVHILDNQ